MKRKVFLARNEQPEFPMHTSRSAYQMFSVPPGVFEHAERGTTYTGPMVKDFCADDFEKFTGFFMQPGECKKVEITIKEVPDGEI